jgi:hypothetical protein
MEIDKSCKWCNNKITIDTDKTKGFKLDYCSLSCNEEYYLKYRHGFKPRKYLDLPYLKLSDKLMDELLFKYKNSNVFNHTII